LPHLVCGSIHVQFLASRIWIFTKFFVFFFFAVFGLHPISHCSHPSRDLEKITHSIINQVYITILNVQTVVEARKYKITVPTSEDQVSLLPRWHLECCVLRGENDKSPHGRSGRAEGVNSFSQALSFRAPNPIYEGEALRTQSPSKDNTSQNCCIGD
jgi:hypothetical protein